MCAQTARKETIAVSYRENVVAGNTIGRQTARHALAPHTDVLAGVTDDGRITRRTRRSVYADNLALRGSLQTEGVVVAQVLLGGEGQLLDVLDGLDIVRTDIQLLEFITIERHIVVDILHNFVQSFALERAHLVATHAFFIRIPNHSFKMKNEK